MRLFPKEVALSALQAWQIQAHIVKRVIYLVSPHCAAFSRGRVLVFYRQCLISSRYLSGCFSLELITG